MEQKELESLKVELRSGCQKRFKLIFESNSEYCINKLLFLHSCSLEDAQDIYVDAIINFREKIIVGKIDAVGDIKTYLYGTCKNMLLTRIRKQQRVSEAISEFYSGHSDSDIDQGHLKYKEHISQLTKEALALLPEKCQHLLKLFYFDKLSMEDIAAKMQFANANVTKVSKARCFQKLIEQIEIIQQEKLTKNHVVKG